MMRKSKASLSFETLEGRSLLASDWQSSPNPLDVDSSGLVIPLDVLLIVNDINQNGVRALPAQRPVDYTGALCDTNGDGILSGLDALQVINVINQFPAEPSLEVKLTSDLNGDQVVLASEFEYELKATPNATIRVERFEGEQALLFSQATASETGSVTIHVQLVEPITHFRFTVSDPRGRSLATERIVRLGDAVTSWNAAMLATVRHTTAPSSTIPGLLIKPPPPMVAKYLAMVHGAMFDAINAVDRQFESYLFSGSAQPGASAVAAAATAAHRVASELYDTPDELVLWDKTLAEVMATVPEGTAKSAGIQVGEQAAAAMLADRANDGSSTTVTYSPGTQPGQWRPTAPDFTAATLPQWPGVKPFAMTEGDQFRPGPVPALTSADYAAAVDEVRRLGDTASTQRTVDQTVIAKFWADGGGTSTPPGHWNQIAIDVGLQQDQTLIENARMMALLNYALADAGIASWDAKYAYNVWRPIDAIRLADTDGNAATDANGNWTPLLNTPSFPAYTSGHSTFSAAAAAVLTELFGNISFSSRADIGSTGVWPPAEDIAPLPVRSFTSFTQAALEAGMSRIYGGIHFSFDNIAGQASGQQIGQLVMGTLLQPLPVS
ncbi:MAG: phosphatase PAP2 family protein [Pirellulaceae bacterium]|nr:phosphatase PAP2 family protein [Pirellulaceae bacterium]